MATTVAARRPFKPDVVALAVCLLACFGAAAIGGMASASAPDFYRQLDRPGFAPPSWVFGPVWTVLYLMQAVAVWLVWREPRRRGRALSLGAFGVQLALNALWSWLFFTWRSGLGAFLEILILDAALLATAVLFSRVRPLAGALLLPYLAWVGFATALTYAIWQRNPGLLG